MCHTVVYHAVSAVPYAVVYHNVPYSGVYHAVSAVPYAVVYHNVPYGGVPFSQWYAMQWRLGNIHVFMHQRFFQ